MGSTFIKVLAGANLALQLVLALVVIGAVRRARAAHFAEHCRTIRVAVPVQLVAIVFVMLPSLAGYLRHPPSRFLLLPELLIHHALGLVPVLWWAYLLLGYAGRVRLPRKLKPLMRVAAMAWGVSLILGLHMFVRMWLLSPVK